MISTTYKHDAQASGRVSTDHDLSLARRASFAVPFHSMVLFSLLAALMLLIVVSPAHAQREVVVKDVPDSQVPNLMSVVAPGARCAAVSEVAGILAIGHKPGTGPHVSLFRLDAEGKPTDAPPMTITLPRPDSLNAHPNFPLSLAFHPAFGLLYVW